MAVCRKCQQEKPATLELEDGSFECVRCWSKETDRLKEVQREIDEYAGKKKIAVTKGKSKKEKREWTLIR